jgi:hypothetical protein
MECFVGHVILQSINLKVQKIKKREWSSPVENQILNALSHCFIKLAQFYYLTLVLVVMGVIGIGAIIHIHLHLVVSLTNFRLRYYTCHLNAPNGLYVTIAWPIKNIKSSTQECST